MKSRLETSQSAFEIFLNDLATDPLPLHSLGCLSSYAASGEWINHEVINVRQHSDEKRRNVNRESRRVWFQSVLSAIADVSGVAFRVSDCQEIWGDRRSVIPREFLRDVVTGWSLLRLVSVREQLLHTLRVRL